ncbi:MAG: 4-(cytidine 5'-diphospho)-2-C-methyl-D-erythritol kinase [Bacteroidota bacterium]
MIVYPNAKINLGLRVLRKRSDGYHDIQSIMLPIPLYDILEITASEVFEYHATGLSIPQDGSAGLVEKAYQLLQQAYGIGPVRIHLRKQIPIGAGLGGGSSDAAFTLKALNEWFSLQLTTKDLHALASQLGSDCPFFIENVPAFSAGRGERLNPISIDLKDLYLALYNPGIHVSTAKAYGAVRPYPTPELSQEIGTCDTWQEKYINDFEMPIGEVHPKIADGISELKRQGAIYAAMSGSGSSYFGLFSIKPKNLISNHQVYLGPLGFID